MKQWMIIGAIALVLILAYMWNRNQNKPNTGEQVPPVEEIITQPDGSVVRRIGDQTQELSEADRDAAKKLVDEKTEEAESVTLKPETGKSGTATSKSSFSDGTYYQKVTVIGMPALEKGFYYEAWLEKADGSRVSIGRMEMTSLSAGQLYYQAKEDRSGSKLIISKQTEGQREMGEVILTQ